ncbi:Histone-lysine N-methyltransferase SETMAR like protein [Argiope bruennichi]|uniref:Histone-lysine N-methyltransferase SETMAR like protein n=1 Tax=Argiope bruennichi TaxID=94029 RepID=A0A8T0FWM9_ARGBR|nr:Histone-lysine N-methyltransferase SETMAR like protein [Argiope bruennichi]
MSIAYIAQDLVISVGNAHSIVRHQMDYRILCSRWVPYSLSSEHKGARFAASLEFLQCYSSKGNDLLIRIIMSDEAWLHHFTQETKQASMEWRHTSSPVRTKSKLFPSAGKVIATVFFDCKGDVYTAFMRKGMAINAESYCETFRFAQSGEKQEMWKVKQRHCPFALQCKTAQGKHNRVCFAVLDGRDALSPVGSLLPIPLPSTKAANPPPPLPNKTENHADVIIRLRNQNQKTDAI